MHFASRGAMDIRGLSYARIEQLIEAELVRDMADIFSLTVEQLVTLSERCRRQSLSWLVPMGQEMAYRYQETLIADLLYALRAFRDRLGP